MGPQRLSAAKAIVADGGAMNCATPRNVRRRAETTAPGLSAGRVLIRRISDLLWNGNGFSQPVDGGDMTD
jgi:hypothetical protein